MSPEMSFGMHDLLYDQQDAHDPQATISLSDATLQNNSIMSPDAMSPDSYYNVKEESVEGVESKKPTTKKRKSWGQELPTPKTHLPPR